ncbi:MAG: hypothetical protein ACO1Q7_08505 [Gemmatimonas sp.]
MIRVRDRGVLIMLPILPAFAVLLALAYWGRYAEQVPAPILAFAGIAVLLAGAVSWANVRYVSATLRRIAQTAAETMTTEHGAVSAVGTAAGTRGRLPTDTLMQLEDIVSGLQTRAKERSAEVARVTSDAEHARVVQTQVMLSVARAARGSLDDVRMPLHILLDNHFGELNDNQEELLGNAKVAADRMEEELRALQGIADLAAGTRTFRADRVRPADLLRSIEPQLQATADRQQVSFRMTLAPDAPSCRCDGAEWRSALLVIIRAGLSHAVPGTASELELLRRDGRSVCVVRDGTVAGASVQELHASRVIVADGGQVARDEGELLITFPGA